MLTWLRKLLVSNPKGAPGSAYSPAEQAGLDEGVRAWKAEFEARNPDHP